MLSSVKVRLTFLDQITIQQFDDASLYKIQNKGLYGEAQDAIFDASNLLSTRGVCTSYFDDVILSLLA